MALFMDGPVSGIEDLTAQDSHLLEIAQVEDINVTQKLALAQDELAVELSTLLTRLSYTEQPFWNTRQPRIEAVVVTPPLKMWHTFRTLDMVYTDAYNSQLNDRYAGKRDQFRARAKWAYSKLAEAGIGMASNAIPRAATPRVTTVSGALPDGTYYVTMAWINQAGEEGASAIPAVTATVACTISVQPGNAPANVIGWKVYVGVGPDSMVQQNTSPVAVESSWVQPNQLVLVGPAPGTGQGPNYLRPVPRVIQRG